MVNIRAFAIPLLLLAGCGSKTVIRNFSQYGSTTVRYPFTVADLEAADNLTFDRKEERPGLGCYYIDDRHGLLIRDTNCDSIPEEIGVIFHKRNGSKQPDWLTPARTFRGELWRGTVKVTRWTSMEKSFSPHKPASFDVETTVMSHYSKRFRRVGAMYIEFAK